MKCVVTGGAGFIGSHLTDSLIAKGNQVVILDNLCEGRKENIPKRARFAKADIVFADLPRIFAGSDIVFHFAADPFVASSAEKPGLSFEQNAVGTFRVLEACRKADVKQFVFASTSTVYGDAKRFPTPEDEPMRPISNYGASKLAGEAYACSYANSYGIKATVLRFANIFGPRSRHGVMWDFFHKLKKNPRELTILGDGMQSKSYLFISDCISATLLAAGKQRLAFDAFNVGSAETTTVKEIARLVCSELGASPKFAYTGGKRGWVGDVSRMLLSTKKIRKLGWKPKVSFREGAVRYAKWMASL